MKRLILSGSIGKTGRVIKAALEELSAEYIIEDEINLGDDYASIIRTGSADVLIDFTCREAASVLIPAALKAGLHVISGSTGLSQEEISEIKELSGKTKKNVILAPNFSIGACLMMKLSTLAAEHMPDYSIVEMHHPDKKDSPSGTAALTSRMISGETDYDRISSVRLTGLVAHQQVIFGGKGQTLTIRHDSMSRESFVPGVLLALSKISGVNGMVDDLASLMF